MSDQTHSSIGHGRSREKAEYKLYFAIIFLLALPFATFFWFRDLVFGEFSKLHHGIVGRALTEAHNITPKIFSA